MKTVSIPLFPLHTVLFPGGPLPLRIFEARYVDMVSNCMKTETGFGVSMIQHGREVGEAAVTCSVGTLANIVDWHMRHDGLLGISTIGGRRFRIASVKVLANQLTMAKVEWLPDEPEIELPNEYLQMVDLLRRLIDQAGHHYALLNHRYADASWVSFRLAELLPISMYRKQQFLEMTDPLMRLEHLVEMLEGLEIL